MDRSDPSPRRHILTAIDGAIALIAVLLIAQMWLLMATLNTYLAGEPRATLPAAIASGVLFLASLGLSLFIERVDASVERSEWGAAPAIGVSGEDVDRIRLKLAEATEAARRALVTLLYAARDPGDNNAVSLRELLDVRPDGGRAARQFASSFSTRRENSPSMSNSNPPSCRSTRMPALSMKKLVGVASTR
jgi:hypothetical protein